MGAIQQRSDCHPVGNHNPLPSPQRAHPPTRAHTHTDLINTECFAVKKKWGNLYMKESFYKIKKWKETKEGFKVILTKFAFSIRHFVCPAFTFNVSVKAKVILEFF